MRTKTTSKILFETSEEIKEKVRNNSNNLIKKNTVMKELLENFLENHLDKHTYPMVAELVKNVMSVHQREIRSIILLNINGVKLEDNMTFTLENKFNKDYSHLIDMSEILDCSEEMFKNYLEEFKSTEKANYLIQLLFDEQKEKDNLRYNKLLNLIKDCREKVDAEVPFGKEDAYDAIINEVYNHK